MAANLKAPPNGWFDTHRPGPSIAADGDKGHGKKQFHKIATDFCSTARRIRRCISRYVPVDATLQAGKKTSKMWNYFLAGALEILWLFER